MYEKSEFNNLPEGSEPKRQVMSSAEAFAENVFEALSKFNPDDQVLIVGFIRKRCRETILINADGAIIESKEFSKKSDHLIALSKLI